MLKSILFTLAFTNTNHSVLPAVGSALSVVSHLASIGLAGTGIYSFFTSSAPVATTSISSSIAPFLPFLLTGFKIIAVVVAGYLVIKLTYGLILNIQKEIHNLILKLSRNQNEINTSERQAQPEMINTLLQHALEQNRTLLSENNNLRARIEIIEEDHRLSDQARTEMETQYTRLLEENLRLYRERDSNATQNPIDSHNHTNPTERIDWSSKLENFLTKATSYTHGSLNLFPDASSPTGSTNRPLCHLVIENDTIVVKLFSAYVHQVSYIQQQLMPESVRISGLDPQALNQAATLLIDKVLEQHTNVISRNIDMESQVCLLNANLRPYNGTLHVLVEEQYTQILHERLHHYRSSERAQQHIATAPGTIMAQ